MRSTVFRIFLSSTFGDFQAEREALRLRVWPVLENYCKARGAAFEMVDLRWGISEADGLSHETLRICLDEVAHCQKLSPKPNFLMLIGDRYGWRPLPTEIPNEDFELILTSLDKDNDSKALLNRWYRIDDNAVPPHYRLQSRDADHQSGRVWSVVESKLISVLRAAVEVFGITPERRERYFLSATHLEIVHGALAVEDARDHVFTIFRDIEGLNPERGPASRFTDLANDKFDTGAATLRAELRKEIGEKIPPEHCFNYQCRWTGKTGNPISTSHIGNLCNDIERSLRDLIDCELATLVGDALDQEIDHHAVFATEMSGSFMGRDLELAEVVDWVGRVLGPAHEGASSEKLVNDNVEETKGSPPLIVHGSGGVGKSAFMAKAVAEIKVRNPDAIVILRFIGASPRSVDLYQFLEDLLRQIARHYGQPEAIPEGSLKILIDELPRRLVWASKDKPLLFFLDALDQFNANFEARHHQWLPRELPPHVAVVLSVLDGNVKNAAMRRFPEALLQPLPLFTREEGGQLLDALLLEGEEIGPHQKRCLTSRQRQLVLDSFDCVGRPLYLVLATSIVRRWPSWYEAESLPRSMEGMVGYIVRHLHARHGERIADRTMDYLTASRFGVSDEEMRDLLWHDSDARAEFDRRKNPDQPAVNSLPPVIWSRIYFDLAPYLIAQSIDGVLLHRFFHRVIGEEVAKVSLADDAHLVHLSLAGYFGRQALYVGDGTDRVPNLRRLMEEPWQLIEAGELQRAEALLTNFDFAMAKCEANRFEDFREDYQRLVDAIRTSGKPLTYNFSIWEEFIRTKGHILRRGNDAWPAHKILLQLAMEHADDSPVTQAAEDFIEQAKCDWQWIKCSTRPEQYVPNPCLLVLEGHSLRIRGVQVLTDGRILSWSGDEGHSKKINGVLMLQDGRLVSWSDDGTIRLWDGSAGVILLVMNGHASSVKGALVLPNRQLLSWSSDKTLRLWDLEMGTTLAVLEGHINAVNGALVLSDNHLLSWSYDHTLRLWNSETATMLAVLEGHEQSIDGVQVLPGDRFLSWSNEEAKLRLWDAKSGLALAVLEGHTDGVEGALVLPDGRLLSWSGDHRLIHRRGPTKSLSRGCLNCRNVGYGGLFMGWLFDGDRNLLSY